ncbi:MAG TPA: YraN family protein [Clostridia bacterium]|nr:YraN family protein [Clostridia bacterium]
MENKKRFSGIWGEIYSARFLRDKGLTILSANYRTRNGEVDLIAQDNTYIVFVEVKARGKGAIAEPKEAVGYTKQKKLTAAALEFLSVNPYGLNSRFDVIEVFLGEEYKLEKINHIENAFDATI